MAEQYEYDSVVKNSTKKRRYSDAVDPLATVNAHGHKVFITDHRKPVAVSPGGFNFLQASTWGDSSAQGGSLPSSSVSTPQSSPPASQSQSPSFEYYSPPASHLQQYQQQLQMRQYMQQHILQQWHEQQLRNLMSYHMLQQSKGPNVAPLPIYQAAANPRDEPVLENNGVASAYGSNMSIARIVSSGVNKPSKKRGAHKQLLLLDFVFRCLSNPKMKGIIHWTGRGFEWFVEDGEMLACMWANTKGNEHMSYDNFGRALRNKSVDREDREGLIGKGESMNYAWRFSTEFMFRKGVFSPQQAWDRQGGACQPINTYRRKKVAMDSKVISKAKLMMAAVFPAYSNASAPKAEPVSPSPSQPCLSFPPLPPTTFPTFLASSPSTS